MEPQQYAALILLKKHYLPDSFTRQKRAKNFLPPKKGSFTLCWQFLMQLIRIVYFIWRYLAADRICIDVNRGVIPARLHITLMLAAISAHNYLHFAKQKAREFSTIVNIIYLFGNKNKYRTIYFYNKINKIYIKCAFCYARLSLCRFFPKKIHIIWQEYKESQSIIKKKYSAILFYTFYIQSLTVHIYNFKLIYTCLLV